MKHKKIKIIILKSIFALIGFVSLFNMIKNYGFNQITIEFQRTGFFLVLLSLTFIPTLICYSLSWLLATDHRQMKTDKSFLKKLLIFFKYTIISVAWNNLTPFLKVGGEPLKYMMLLKYLEKKEALTSTINYNLIHTLATGVSFFISFVLLFVLYPLSAKAQIYLLIFASTLCLLAFFIFFIIRSKKIYVIKNNHYRFIKVAIINVRLIFKRLLVFFKKNPQTFFWSLMIDVFARFIEGLTFYFGFYLLKHPISFLSSALLDVGRTFIDTVFFFVPYQVGTREEGVHFFMEKMLMIDSYGFLTAVFFYRFVEIVWIFIGYMIWVSAKSSTTEVK